MTSNNNLTASNLSIALNTTSVTEGVAVSEININNVSSSSQHPQTTPSWLSPPTWRTLAAQIQQQGTQTSAPFTEAPAVIPKATQPSSSQGRAYTSSKKHTHKKELTSSLSKRRQRRDVQNCDNDQYFVRKDETQCFKLEDLHPRGFRFDILSKVKTEFEKIKELLPSSSSDQELNEFLSHAVDRLVLRYHSATQQDNKLEMLNFFNENVKGKFNSSQLFKLLELNVQEFPNNAIFLQGNEALSAFAQHLKTKDPLWKEMRNWPLINILLIGILLGGGVVGGVQLLLFLCFYCKRTMITEDLAVDLLTKSNIKVKKDTDNENEQRDLDERNREETRLRNLALSGFNPLRFNPEEHEPEDTAAMQEFLNIYLNQRAQEQMSATETAIAAGEVVSSNTAKTSKKAAKSKASLNENPPPYQEGSPQPHYLSPSDVPNDMPLPPPAYNGANFFSSEVLGPIVANRAWDLADMSRHYLILQTRHNAIKEEIKQIEKRKTKQNSYLNSKDRIKIRELYQVLGDVSDLLLSKSEEIEHIKRENLKGEIEVIEQEQVLFQTDETGVLTRVALLDNCEGDEEEKMLADLAQTMNEQALPNYTQATYSSHRVQRNLIEQVESVSSRTAKEEFKKLAELNKERLTKARCLELEALAMLEELENEDAQDKTEKQQKKERLSPEKEKLNVEKPKKCKKKNKHLEVEEIELKPLTQSIEAEPLLEPENLAKLKDTPPKKEDTANDLEALRLASATVGNLKVPLNLSLQSLLPLAVKQGFEKAVSDKAQVLLGEKLEQRFTKELRNVREKGNKCLDIEEIAYEVTVDVNQTIGKRLNKKLESTIEATIKENLPQDLKKAREVIKKPATRIHLNQVLSKAVGHVLFESMESAFNQDISKKIVTQLSEDLICNLTLGESLAKMEIEEKQYEKETQKKSMIMQSNEYYEKMDDVYQEVKTKMRAVVNEMAQLETIEEEAERIALDTPLNRDKALEKSIFSKNPAVYKSRMGERPLKGYYTGMHGELSLPAPQEYKYTMDGRKKDKLNESFVELIRKMSLEQNVKYHEREEKTVNILVNRAMDHANKVKTTPVINQQQTLSIASDKIEQSVAASVVVNIEPAPSAITALRQEAPKVSPQNPQENIELGLIPTSQRRQSQINFGSVAVDENKMGDVETPLLADVKITNENGSH